MALPALPHATLSRSQISERLSSGTAATLAPRGSLPLAEAPFEVGAIAAALRSKQTAWTGVVFNQNTGERTTYQMVPVVTPSSLGDVSQILRGLQKKSGFGLPILQREFAALSYANGQGDVRTFIAQGDSYETKFPPTFTDRNGQAWMLSTVIAHSHPEKHPIPSGGDASCVSWMEEVTGQKRSLVTGRTSDVFLAPNGAVSPAHAGSLSRLKLDDLYQTDSRR